MKYVIFDIDGTLANTKKVEDKCFMQAFQNTFGIDIWNQDWASLKNVTDWGITEEIIQRELNRIPLAEEYDLMIQNFVSLLESEHRKDPKQFQEVRGASDFFKKLLEHKNCEVGIATGSWEQSALLKLSAIGIDTTDIPFSNSNYYKSREAITKDVIRQLDIKNMSAPDEIIYFGDGEWDYKTCKKIGITFIGIDVEEDGKLKNLGAQNIFKNFENSQSILNLIFA